MSHIAYFQLSDEVNSIYQRDTFLSRLIHQLVLPPYKETPGNRSPRTRHTDQQFIDLASKPRISLRFLANYQVLAYLALAYLLAYMWLGFGPIPYIFCLILAVLLYASFKAQFSSKAHHVQQD